MCRIKARRLLAQIKKVTGGNRSHQAREAEAAQRRQQELEEQERIARDEQRAREMQQEQCAAVRARQQAAQAEAARQKARELEEQAQAAHAWQVLLAEEELSAFLQQAGVIAFQDQLKVSVCVYGALLTDRCECRIDWVYLLSRV